VEQRSEDTAAPAEAKAQRGAGMRGRGEGMGSCHPAPAEARLGWFEARSRGSGFGAASGLSVRRADVVSCWRILFWRLLHEAEHRQL